MAKLDDRKEKENREAEQFKHGAAFQYHWILNEQMFLQVILLH